MRLLNAGIAGSLLINPIALLDAGAPPAPFGDIRPLPLAFTNKSWWPVAVLYDKTRDVPFYTDYNYNDWVTPGAVEYWVDPVNGLDANPGTLVSPKKTIAAVKNATTGNIRVFVDPGLTEPIGDIPNGRHIEVVGTDPDKVFCGEFITQSEIASISAVSGGNQSIMLNNPTTDWVDGYVDLESSFTGLIDKYGVERKFPTVAAECGAYGSNPAVSMALFQGADDRTRGKFKGGGIIRGANGVAATVGTKDSRQLTASDFATWDGTGTPTGILAWKKQAAAPFTITGTGRLTAYGIYFVGGKGVETADDDTAWLVIERGGVLGATGDVNVVGDGVQSQPMFNRCTTILVDCVVWGSHLNDVIDGPANGNKRDVHQNVVIGGGRLSGGNQGSTTHAGSRGFLNIGCTFAMNIQAIGNLGPYMEGAFSLRIYHGDGVEDGAGGPLLLNTIEDGAFHCGDLEWIGPPAASSSVKKIDIAADCAIYDYTGHVAALPAEDIIIRSTSVAYTPGRLFDFSNSLVWPTGTISDAILTTPYLRQNTDGTGAVTAQGDPVRHIIDQVSGTVAKLLSGTAYYDEIINGVPGVAGYNMQWEIIFPNGPPGFCDIFLAASCRSDVTPVTSRQWYPLHRLLRVSNAKGSTPVMHITSSGSAPVINPDWYAVLSQCRVNGGSVLTQKSQVQAAMLALTTTPKVLSLQNLDMYSEYYRGILIDTPTTAQTLGVSGSHGKYYGWRIVTTDPANYAANLAAISARAGL